jgi:hypothetical protein
MTHVLLTYHHPWSPSKSDRLQTLLTTSGSSSSSPSNPTTRSIFLPSTRPKAPFKQLSQHPATKSADGRPLLIGAVEIYDSPDGLLKQNQQLQESVKSEALYAREVEESAWRVAGGFVSRSSEAGKRRKGGGEGTKKATVMLARFECKEGEEARRKVVAGLA